MGVTTPSNSKTHRLVNQRRHAARPNHRKICSHYLLNLKRSIEMIKFNFVTNACSKHEGNHWKKKTEVEWTILKPVDEENGIKILKRTDGMQGRRKKERKENRTVNKRWQKQIQIYHLQNKSKLICLPLKARILQIRLKIKMQMYIYKSHSWNMMK